MISGDFGPESEDLRQALAGTGYRYISVLGSGAMGDVIEAEHVLLGTRVAVKLLKRLDLHPDEVARVEDRMRIEAQACARLDHPNLLKVLHFGVTETGRTFFVSERLVGRTLRAELDEREVLPVLSAIAIMTSVLDGLRVVHEAGIVHRDVKPDNVFLTDALPGGVRGVKLLDFGLAKIVDAARDPTTPAPLLVPTNTGARLGTPHFMAPEQSAGRRDVDQRADVYSAGAVLYALIAGRTPFQHHRGVFEIMRAQISEVPLAPAHYAKQSLPPELDRAILKALAKAPADRFQSAGELKEELLRIATSLDRSSAPSIPPSPAPVASRRWLTTERLTPVPPSRASSSMQEEQNVRVAPPKTAKGTDIMGRDAVLWEAGRGYRESLASPVSDVPRVIIAQSQRVDAHVARPYVGPRVETATVTPRAASSKESWRDVIAVVALLGLLGLAIIAVILVLHT